MGYVCVNIIEKQIEIHLLHVKIKNFLKNRIDHKNQLQMAGFYKKQYEDIKVEPVDCKKIVVKHYGIFIDLTVGILKISGDMNALQYLYQSGAGSHHATGFGSLNVIRQGGR